MPMRPPKAVPPKHRHGVRRSRQIGSYTSSAWRKLRAFVLQRDPFCKAPGCNRPSTVADHIVPRRQGGTDDPAQLQGLCASHHSIFTNRFESGWGNPLREGKPGRVT